MKATVLYEPDQNSLRVYRSNGEVIDSPYAVYVGDDYNAEGAQVCRVSGGQVTAGQPGATDPAALVVEYGGSDGRTVIKRNGVEVEGAHGVFIFRHSSGEYRAQIDTWKSTIRQAQAASPQEAVVSSGPATHAKGFIPLPPTPAGGRPPHPEQPSEAGGGPQPARSNLNQDVASFFDGGFAEVDDSKPRST